MSQSGTYISNTGPGGYVETLTGNSGGAVPPSGGNINVVGDGTTIVVTGNPATNTLTISAGGADAQSFPTDSGTASPSSGVLNIKAGLSTLNCGSTVSFSGSGNTVTLHLSDAIANTIIGNGAGIAGITGETNVGLGGSALAALTTANACTGIGYNALLACTTGTENTAVGNTALGFVVGGEDNTAIGFHAGYGITSGEGNFFAGYYAGTNYSGGESFNVLIDSLGSNGESNVLRIGEGTGTDPYELNAAYICGINGVNVGSVASVVSINGDHLGSTVITAGTGVTVTAGANTITISASGTTNLTYTPVNHAASPYTVLSTDDYISADVTGGVITIKLPNAPATGKVYIVKDKVGLAATSNITVTTVGGAVTIDGGTSFAINTAYQSIQVIFNGTNYEVF